MEASNDANPIIKQLARTISSDEMLNVSGGVSTIVKREYSMTDSAMADGGLDENTYGKGGKYEGKDTVERT